MLEDKYKAPYSKFTENMAKYSKRQGGDYSGLKRAFKKTKEDKNMFDGKGGKGKEKIYFDEDAYVMEKWGRDPVEVLKQKLE